MRRFILTVATLLVLGGQQVVAGDYQHLSVNGKPLTKHVDKITFTDEFIINLVYSDETVEHYVTSSFKAVLDTPSGIDKLSIYGGVDIQGNQLSVKGLKAGTPIAIYDLAGKQLVNAKATAETSTIDISSMKQGVYLLKSGTTVIKFERR